LIGSRGSFEAAEDLPYAGLRAAAVELRAQRAELTVDFPQARGEPIPLVLERTRERDDGLDETPLPFLDARQSRADDLLRMTRGFYLGHR
jgi:hypothetical protein